MVLVSVGLVEKFVLHQRIERTAVCLPLRRPKEQLSSFSEWKSSQDEFRLAWLQQGHKKRVDRIPTSVR